MAKPRPKHKKPRRPSWLLRTLVRVASVGDLHHTHFTYTQERMELVGKQPCLILMNHSSFLDLKIASKIFYPRPYCIVCTSDGFVGKHTLMRHLGCIPTQKFVSDITLIRDIQYALTHGSSVLMYPEASYSFDGTATPLPRRLGQLMKLLKVPVVTVITRGAFAYDPLYNGLQKRDVKVTAEVKCLYTPEEIAEHTVDELDAGLDAVFSFDNFAWQVQNNVKIAEPFRADGLNRILYRCPACGQEGHMEGKGIHLTCHACRKQWELTVLGQLHAVEGKTEFAHIPDWYHWERECVRGEIESGTYHLDIPVRIGVMVDFKAIHMIGTGRLVHTAGGFDLTGCDGKLEYHQKPLASYSLYSDYYWYEIGDVICIGNRDCLYYCFPDGVGDVVAKTRLAAEELYKLGKASHNPKR